MKNADHGYCSRSFADIRKADTTSSISQFPVDFPLPPYPKSKPVNACSVLACSSFESMLPAASQIVQNLKRLPPYEQHQIITEARIKLREQDR